MNANEQTPDSSWLNPSVEQQGRFASGNRYQGRDRRPMDSTDALDVDDRRRERGARGACRHERIGLPIRDRMPHD